MKFGGDIPALLACPLQPCSTPRITAAAPSPFHASLATTTGTRANEDEPPVRLLPSLHLLLRLDLIRYGELGQISYHSFDYDPYSWYCSFKYPRRDFFEQLGMPGAARGYAVTCYPCAMSSFRFPHIFRQSRAVFEIWSQPRGWAGATSPSAAAAGASEGGDRGRSGGASTIRLRTADRSISFNSYFDWHLQLVGLVVAVWIMESNKVLPPICRLQKRSKHGLRFDKKIKIVIGIFDINVSKVQTELEQLKGIHVADKDHGRIGIMVANEEQMLLDTFRNLIAAT
ncbi:hypothetical protein EJB05_50470, partial [Eragrostis curvula]